MSEFLQQFRAQYPEYDDVSDDNLVAGLHDKYRQDVAPNMSLDQFKQSIGFTPLQPPSLANVPDVMGQMPQNVQQTGVPQAPRRKSMYERINEKLINMGAGVAERAGDLAGSTLQATRTLANSVDQGMNTGLIGFEEGSYLPTYFSAEEVRRRRIPNYSQQAEQAMQNADFGYREQVAWNDVKDTYSDEGMSPELALTVAEYGIEQGAKSIPDMVAVLTSLPVYVLGRSHEMGTERAKNSGRTEATAQDLAEAAPFALGSALLERIGAKGVTNELVQQTGRDLIKAGFANAAARVAQSGGKAMTKEAMTEAVQEGMIEYAGEKFGTDAAMSLAEAGDRALGAAVAGGVFGGASGTGAGAYREGKLAKDRQALARDQRQQFNVQSSDYDGDITKPSKAVVQTVGALAPQISRAEFGDTDQYARSQFDPRNAQYVYETEEQRQSRISDEVDEQVASFQPPEFNYKDADLAIDREGNQDTSIHPIIQKAINMHDDYDSKDWMTKEDNKEFKKLTGVQVDLAFPYRKLRNKPNFARGKNVPDLYDVITKGRIVNDAEAKRLLTEMYGDQDPPVQISIVGKNKNKKGKVTWHKDSVVSVLFNTQEEADAYAALVQRDFGKPFSLPETKKAERNLPDNVDVAYGGDQFNPTGIVESPENSGQVEQKVSGSDIVEAPVNELTLSSDIPQFKSGANAEGVVDPLGGSFDRTGVGPIQVWVRKDGRKEVISGRHRLDLAKRSGETTIPAQFHYESEGFDRDQAAMLDALLNIREGQGKVKDYVEFIKGTKLSEAEADAQGVLARQTGRRAYTIATQGSDVLIASHRNDDITDEAAERLSKAAPQDENLQALGLEALNKGRSITYAENLMKALSTFEPSGEVQGDLFGFDDSIMQEAAKMAEIAASKQQDIQKSLSAIRGAAKNPERARQQGVDIKDPDAVKARIKDLSQQKKDLDNWATNPTLTQEIKAEANGESKPAPKQEPSKKAKDFFDKLRGVENVDLPDDLTKMKAGHIDRLDYRNGIKEVAEKLNVPVEPYEHVLDIRSKIKEKLGIAEVKKRPKEEYSNYQKDESKPQYHGTGTPISDLAEYTYSHQNYYGQGLYTTDSLDIAKGYSRSRKAKEPTVYRIELKKKPKLYDMEQPITAELRDWLETYGGDFLDFALADSENEAVTLRELYDAGREYGIATGESADLIQESFTAVQEYLENQGYDGLRHVGGSLTNHAPHNVEIYFNPPAVLDLVDVNEEQSKPQSIDDVINQAKSSQYESMSIEQLEEAKATFEKQVKEARQTIDDNVWNDGMQGHIDRVVKPSLEYGVDQIVEINKMLKKKGAEVEERQEADKKQEIVKKHRAFKEDKSLERIRRIESFNHEIKTVADGEALIAAGNAALNKFKRQDVEALTDEQKQDLVKEYSTKLDQLQRFTQKLKSDTPKELVQSQGVIDAYDQVRASYSGLKHNDLDEVDKQREQAKLDKAESYLREQAKNNPKRKNYSWDVTSLANNYTTAELHLWAQEIRYNPDNWDATGPLATYTSLNKKAAKQVDALEYAILNLKREERAKPDQQPVKKDEPFTMADYRTFQEKVSKREAKKEEIDQVFDALKANKEGILQELNSRAYKKDDLYRMARTFRNDLKKAQYASLAYDAMLRDCIMQDNLTITFSFGEKASDQYEALVKNQAQEDIDNFYTVRANKAEAHLKQLEARKKALDNPETLEEFQVFIRVKGKDAMTGEQLATYDEMVAASLKPEDRPKVIKALGQKVPYTLHETTHTKKGHDLWVVSLDERLDRNQYEQLLEKAKALNGYYSTYSKGGAIAGFQFKTPDEAKQFTEILDDQTVDASNTAEANADVKRAERADKLAELADNIEAKATEKLNAPRQTNTAKRAREAASAMDSAYKEIAFAQTLRKISAGVAAGTIQHLGNITAATQLENLYSVKAKFQTWSKDPQGDRTKNPLEDFIADVVIPQPWVWTDGVRSAIRELEAGGKKGSKTLIKALSVYRLGDNKASDIPIELAQRIVKAQKDGLLDKSSLWQVKDALDRVTRLTRIGITTDEQLRAALRELNAIETNKSDLIDKTEQELKQLEMDLIGQKIDGYFPTPKELVEQMLDLADISEGDTVLEPSAGKGNIADVITSYVPNVDIKVIEPVSSLRRILELKGYELVDRNFLDHKTTYDKIIMNPPFENFQDIDHVRHAYSLLKPNGTLVAIMGAGVKNSRVKAKEFRAWLEAEGGVLEDLPEGSFKSSERSTGVNTVLVVLHKADAGVLESRNASKSKKRQYPKVGEKLNSLDDTYNATGANHLATYGELGLPERHEVFVIDGKTHTMPKEVQRHEPILSSLIDIAGRRIYFSKIRGKSRLGFYNTRTGELRTKKANDVEIWAHELAHYLDFYSDVTLPNFGELYKSDEYSREVMGLSYTDQTKKLQQLEGFAEFVRLWLTNSYEAQVRAPRFYTAFERLLRTDKKLQKKMKKMQLQMHRYYLQGPLDIARAKKGSVKSFNEWFGELSLRRGSRLRQQLLDRTHAARRIEQNLKGVIGNFDQSAWKQMRIANGGYESITDSILNHGTVNFDSNGDLVITGKGLHEILSRVESIDMHEQDKRDPRAKDMTQLLMEYFVGRRAKELAGQGRENLFGPQEIQKFLEHGTRYPEFESIFEEYQGFNDRMLDFYIASGLISEDQKKAFQEMNKAYVPFFRVREALDDLNRGANSSKLGKRLKGGTANIKDVLLNITEGVQSNVKAALDNRAKAQLYQYIDNNKDGALYAVAIKTDTKAVKVLKNQMVRKVREIFNMLELEFDDYFIGNAQNEMDMVEDALTANDMDEFLAADEGAGDKLLINHVFDQDMLLFWQNGVRPKLGESGNTVDFYVVDGKPQYYEVQDPMLHEMLLAMNPHAYGAFMRSLFAIKNGFTRSITLGLEFTGANLVRDTIGAAIMSKGRFIPFVDSFRGMASYFMKDEHYQEWLRHGGGYSSRLESLSDERNARRRVQIKNFGALSYYERFISVLDRFVSAFEYGTRLGEFRVAKRQGESNFDAVFRAREISTDFSVQGASSFWSGYVRTVPFFNAMIQSQDRVYREALISKRYDGNPYAFAMKAFLGITLPSLILWMINKDDEEYKKIPEAEKRTNWHIPVGDRFIKIPKPYDVGFIFGTMPELFMQYTEDKRGKNFAQGMLWTLTQMYGVDGTPAFLTGFLDLARNKDWTGAPVVPKNLEGVSLKNQYNTSTSEIFIQMGEMTRLSPIQAEHAFRAYTGYLGGYLVAGVDYMMWDTEKFGERPETDLSDNPAVKRFITPEVRRYTSDMERFWQLKEDADNATADIRQGMSIRMMIKYGPEMARKRAAADPLWGYTKEEKEALNKLNNRMNTLAGAVYGPTGINTQLEAIRYDKGRTAAEKKRDMEYYYTKRNMAFDKAIDSFEQVLKDVRKLADKRNNAD